MTLAVAALALVACDEPRAASTASPMAQPAETPTAADGSELPRSCVEYRRVMGLLARCETFSEPMRASLHDDFMKMEAQFTAIATMPADARAAMAQRCTTAVDGIEKAAGAICGF